MLRHASRAYACRLWRTFDLRLSCFPDGCCSALPDCSVIGCKRNAVSTSGSNNQTIGRVSVERRGKTGKCDHNVNIEWYDFDHCGASRISYPDVERAIQHKAALCVQHLGFPKAHRRQAQSGPRRQPIQSGSFPLLEPTGPEQPPKPYMRIQQDFHRDASNSRSSIIDSCGSAFSSPDPRRISQALGIPLPGVGGGASRATTLPRRLISTGSASISTRRMISRQRARKCVTEMSMPGSYMAIFEPARGCLGAA